MKAPTLQARMPVAAFLIAVPAHSRQTLLHRYATSSANNCRVDALTLAGLRVASVFSVQRNVLESSLAHLCDLRDLCLGKCAMSIIKKHIIMQVVDVQTPEKSLPSTSPLLLIRAAIALGPSCGVGNARWLPVWATTTLSLLSRSTIVCGWEYCPWIETGPDWGPTTTLSLFCRNEFTWG